MFQHRSGRAALPVAACAAPEEDGAGRRSRRIGPIRSALFAASPLVLPFCPHQGSRSTLRAGTAAVARLGRAGASWPTEETARAHATPEGGWCVGVSPRREERRRHRPSVHSPQRGLPRTRQEFRISLRRRAPQGSIAVALARSPLSDSAGGPGVVKMLGNLPRISVRIGALVRRSVRARFLFS